MDAAAQPWNVRRAWMPIFERIVNSAAAAWRAKALASSIRSRSNSNSARFSRLVAVWGWFWSKNLLGDLERFLIEWFGFGVRPSPRTAWLGYSSRAPNLPALMR